MTELDITKILRNYGARLDFSEHVRIEPMHTLGEEVTFDEPFSVSGSIVNQGESFLLRAKAEGTLSAKCSLCRAPVRAAMRLDIEETLLHHPNRRTKYGVDKDEADFLYAAEKEGAFVFTTHMLDLSKLVGDSIFLELPTRFLCKADCKGLCPRCGANLNQEECTCSK